MQMAYVTLNRFHILQRSAALKHKTMLNISLRSYTVTLKSEGYKKRDKVLARTYSIFSLEQK